MKTCSQPASLRGMAIRHFRLQVSLLPCSLAVFFALFTSLQAQPRVLADEEMDQVCAKGSAGFNVDSVALNQMVFDFSRQTSLGWVSGSGSINVEALSNPSGKSQISVGPQTTTGSALATDLQVVNGTVRVTGDVNINMQTLPAVQRALQQNRLVLPPGLNLWAGAVAGMGGMR